MLDRPSTRSYIGACIAAAYLVGACHPHLPPLVPMQGAMAVPADPIAQCSRDGGPVVAGLRDSTHLMWRAARDSDTLEYRVTQGSTPMLEAEWRGSGSVMARSRTVLGPAGLPASARIDVPKGHARFELTFVGVDSGAVFP